MRPLLENVIIPHGILKSREEALLGLLRISGQQER
jgi:hypothetical protein